MSFNEKLSYTEFVVENPTTDFNIGFSFTEDIDKLGLLIDDVDANEAGYTYRLKNSMTVEVTPPIASGIVRIYRETNLDSTRHVFKAAAKFVAANMDTNFTQLLHSQQEVRDQTNAFYNRIDIQINDFTTLVSDVQGEFQAVREQVDSAEAIANAANKTSQDALDVANAIANTAQDAFDTAERAENTADAIAATANQAMTMANDAEVQAADAVIKAANATTIAEGIAGTANEANMIANESRELAVEAKDVANDALAQTTLQPATSTTLGGIKVGTEFAMATDNTLTLSGTVTRDLQVNGGIVATGNITAFSDIRLKYDVNYVVDALDKVCSLNGVTFKRIYDHKPSVGLIAQDVQRVLPEAVIPQGDYLTVDYLGVIGLLVEAIKDLEHRVKLLGG